MTVSCGEFREALEVVHYADIFQILALMTEIIRHHEILVYNRDTDNLESIRAIEGLGTDRIQIITEKYQGVT